MLSVVCSALVILSSLSLEPLFFVHLSPCLVFILYVRNPPKPSLRTDRNGNMDAQLLCARSWDLEEQCFPCLFVFFISFCFVLLRFDRHTISHSAHARPCETGQYIHKQQKRQERIAEPSSVGNDCQISYSHVEDLWNDWRRTINWISSDGQKFCWKCEITLLSMELRY